MPVSVFFFCLLVRVLPPFVLLLPLLFFSSWLFAPSLFFEFPESSDVPRRFSVLAIQAFLGLSFLHLPSLWLWFFVRRRAVFSSRNATSMSDRRSFYFYNRVAVGALSKRVPWAFVPFVLSFWTPDFFGITAEFHWPKFTVLSAVAIVKLAFAQTSRRFGWFLSWFLMQFLQPRSIY